jgi:AraC-like DNA-binding protein
VRTLISGVTLARSEGADITTLGRGRSHAAAPEPRPLTPTMLEGRVRKILHMVESGTTFTVLDLAREFHLSPPYLRRFFKHQTGVSMGEWLNEQRLQRAAHLLENSYMSVKEIATSLGMGMLPASSERLNDALRRPRRATGNNVTTQNANERLVMLITFSCSRHATSSKWNLLYGSIAVVFFLLVGG